jgi:hypothetical protein
VWVAAVVVTGVVLVVAARNGDLGDTSSLTAVLGFAVSVAGLAASLLREGSTRESGPRLDERINRLTEQLASAVKEQWQAEWRLRQLQDPAPLQVRWALADPWLADHQENIGGSADLSDRLGRIAEVFDRVPSKRLVVLGGPGSGKTVLALRFTLDMLERRQPADPIPVVFSLSTWLPDHQSLHDWMAASLATTYPGAAWGRELLSAGRVLPVLDGLDEIPPPLRPQAVGRLNAELDPGSPVLITCRTHVYADVIEDGDVFTAAPVVELQPLTFQDASAYLLRTARPVRGPDGQRATRWDQVLAHLRSRPDEPASRALRQVLSTPLMVAMARTVYEDTSSDPGELLDLRFHHPAALEQHLLDAFVPAAFRDTSATTGHDARRWLGFLARHLQQLHTADLAWWELRRALPGPLRLLGPLLILGGAAIAVVAGLYYWGKGAVADASFVTGTFMAGICIGYLVLFHRPTTLTAWRRTTKRTPPGIALAAAAIPLGIALGATVELVTFYDGFDPLQADFDPFQTRGLPEMAGGLATVLVLAVLGTTGAPHPSTMSFRRSGRARSPRPLRVISAVAVLFAAGIVYLLIVMEFPGKGLGAVAIAVVAGILATIAVWKDPGVIGRNAPARDAAQMARPRRQLGRTVVRNVATGLFAGLCLGAAFGLAEATIVAVRAGTQSEFPAAATPHELPDGTRYAITPDGWGYGKFPDGSKYARTPGPVRGFVFTDPDFGSERAATPESAEGYWGCPNRPPGGCEPFYGQIEIHLSSGAHGSLRVKLPSGVFVDDDDFQFTSPPRTLDWLHTPTPGRLFSDTAVTWLATGLVLGLASGVAAGLQKGLVSPTDTARASSPLASLRTDRATALTQGIVVTAFVEIITMALVIVTTEELPFGAIIVMTVFLVAGPVGISLSAWGWLLVARLWLCGTGRLPWRLMAFLDDAHRRGVLRQAGAVYQFRHARLQEQLASADPGGGNRGTPLH